MDLACDSDQIMSGRLDQASQDSPDAQGLQFLTCLGPEVIRFFSGQMNGVGSENHFLVGQQLQHVGDVSVTSI